MQRPPTAHRLQVDEMEPVLVTYELIADVEYDGVLGPVDVAPRKPEDLASAQSEGQGEHEGGLVAMALHGAEELLRLVWGEAPALAVVQLRSFSDRGDVSTQDPVLFGHAKCPSQRRACYSSGRGRIALGFEVPQHPTDVRRGEFIQTELPNRWVDVDLHRPLVDGRGPRRNRAGNPIGDPTVEILTDGQSVRGGDHSLGDDRMEFAETLDDLTSGSRTDDFPRPLAINPAEINRAKPFTVLTLINRSLAYTSSTAHETPLRTQTTRLATFAEFYEALSRYRTYSPKSL